MVRGDGKIQKINNIHRNAKNAEKISARLKVQE